MRTTITATQSYHALVINTLYPSAHHRQGPILTRYYRGPDLVGSYCPRLGAGTVHHPPTLISTIGPYRITTNASGQTITTDGHITETVTGPFSPEQILDEHVQTVSELRQTQNHTQP